MNRTLRFEKEQDNTWYAVIPEWTGAKGDLQMVLGADLLLEIMSDGDDVVNVHFSTEPFEGSNVMSLFMYDTPSDPNAGGAMYRMFQYMGIEYNLDLWLCDVTRFVFGSIPHLIHFNRAM